MIGMSRQQFLAATAMRLMAQRALPKTISESMAKFEIAGLPAALVMDGREVVALSYGVKDTDTNEAVNAATVFQVASLTKPVFANCFVAFLVRPARLVVRRLLGMRPE